MLFLPPACHASGGAWKRDYWKTVSDTPYNTQPCAGQGCPEVAILGKRRTMVSQLVECHPGSCLGGTGFGRLAREGGGRQERYMSNQHVCTR